MISCTLVCGLLPDATARIAMSRSVNIPTSRSPSPTGRAPASISAISRAASAIVCCGLASRTFAVIASLTRMESSIGLAFSSRSASALDYSRGRLHCASAARPQVADRLWQGVAYLLHLPRLNVMVENLEYRPHAINNVNRPRALEFRRHAIEKLLAAALLQVLLAGVPLIVIGAAYQQR